MVSVPMDALGCQEGVSGVDQVVEDLGLVGRHLLLKRRHLDVTA